MARRKTYKTNHSEQVVRGLELMRRELAYSQQQMADALGVPHRTYQKWLYTEQTPRHGAALLARAASLAGGRRVNCWEVLECGRQPGGAVASELGTCPAATDTTADRVNTGRNGGRVCWAISGTFCGMGNGIEGSLASKLVSCLGCKFFQQVRDEEGLANFKLLKPGQTYTQR